MVDAVHRKNAGACTKNPKRGPPMSEQARIRILCVDDHPLLREAIAAIISFQPDMVLVGEASNGNDAIQKFREHRPDVTLMDLRLPDMSGVDTLIAIRADVPEARII